MLYVASVITLSAFSDLLWNFSLLVRYKLKRFRPPRVKQFDICAILVRRLRQVYTITLNGISWLAENLL